MMRRVVLLLAALVILASCAGYAERISPCACDWRPLGDGAEVLA